MHKSIVRIISENDQPAKAVEIVQKSLKKKLLEAISSQKKLVATSAYGSLEECDCGTGDESPVFVSNPGDNTYSVFYANALKKFGVTGPQDFRDDATKNAFFNYVDHNWRAQDAVQAQPPLQPSNQPLQTPNSNGKVDQGTLTNLPAPAMQPKAPQVPGAGVTGPDMETGFDDDNGSLAQMSPVSPTDDVNEPLGQSGSDPVLNKQQAMGTGQAPIGNVPNGNQTPMMKGTSPDGSDSQIQDVGDDGMDQDPTGMNLDQDPDLEIGDEDNNHNDPNFDEDPEDERQDQPVGSFAGENNFSSGSDPDLDSDFDDEDAYTIDPSEFGNRENNHDSDDNYFDDDGQTDADDENNQTGDDNDDDGNDDNGNSDNETDSPNTDDSDQDPDLEIGDKKDSKKFPPSKGKKKGSFPPKKKGFSEALVLMDRDDQLDEAFVNQMQQTPGVDTRKLRYIQSHLNAVKKSRNVTRMRLKHLRRGIKNDSLLSPEHKQSAMQQLGVMAKQSRDHHKNLAKGIKAIHTGAGLNNKKEPSMPPTNNKVKGNNNNQVPVKNKFSINKNNQKF